MASAGTEGLRQVDRAGKRGKGLPSPGTKYGEHEVAAFLTRRGSP